MEYWKKNNTLSDAEKELTAILSKQINKEIISKMGSNLLDKTKCSGELELKVVTRRPINRQYRPVEDTDLDEWSVCNEKAKRTKSKKNKQTKQTNKFVSNNYGDPFNFLKYLNNDKNGFNL